MALPPAQIPLTIVPTRRTVFMSVFAPRADWSFAGWQLTLTTGVHDVIMQENATVYALELSTPFFSFPFFQRWRTWMTGWMVLFVPYL